MSGQPTPGPWEQAERARQENDRLRRINSGLLEAARLVLRQVFLNAGASDSEARTTEALGLLAEAVAKAEGQ